MPSEPPTRSPAAADRVTTNRRNEGARTPSEVTVYLCEDKFTVLTIVLRDAVVVAGAHAQLQKLKGGVLPHDAEPVLIVVTDSRVRIEILARNLEIVSLGDSPV